MALRIDADLLAGYSFLPLMFFLLSPLFIFYFIFYIFYFTIFFFPTPDYTLLLKREREIECVYAHRWLSLFLNSDKCETSIIIKPRLYCWNETCYGILVPYSRYRYTHLYMYVCMCVWLSLFFFNPKFSQLSNIR